ncbi:MAG: nitrate reductase cytochrome c-type subunit [Sulfurimonas sp.]|nr:nitrate reductase cytochrome c-type subunit [Sulfurimonas sp.]MDD3834226.1 nitrate reductase cytochrome c-type subunit [Sulfurimonas sp.]
MRLLSKVTVGLFTAALLFVGCGNDAKPTAQESVKPTISEESLGLRKTDIYVETDETIGHQANYSTAVAGSGNTIKRAFQDAPPMVPHDTEGMLPITISDNQCTTCHMPEVAESMGATPVPSSHFTDFRPVTSVNAEGRLTKNGKAIVNTTNVNMDDISIKSTGDQLAGSRFNCTLCHAPQSGDDIAVKNTFEPDFTNKDGASASSWNGTKLMEGLDTVNGI